MTLTIPFSYDTYYLPSPRRRKILSRTDQDEAKVYIKEISEKDFPVACIIHDNSTWCDKAPDVTLRFDGEDFWRSHPGLEAYAKRAYLRNMSYDNTQEDFADCENPVIKGNNRKEKIEEIRDNFAHYVYCDDTYWSKGYEPVYRLYANDYVDVITFQGEHDYGCSYIFNATDKDNIVGENLYFSTEIEVLLPEAFRYGKNQGEIDTTISNVLKKIWKKTFDPPRYSQPLLAKKALDAVMPEVCQRVRLKGDLEYQFNEDIVTAVLAEILDERLGG